MEIWRQWHGQVKCVDHQCGWSATSKACGQYGCFQSPGRVFMVFLAPISKTWLQPFDLHVTQHQCVLSPGRTRFCSKLWHQHKGAPQSSKEQNNPITLVQPLHHSYWSLLLQKMLKSLCICTSTDNLVSSTIKCWFSAIFQGRVLAIQRVSPPSQSNLLFLPTTMQSWILHIFPLNQKKANPTYWLMDDEDSYEVYNDSLMSNDFPIIWKWGALWWLF